MKIALKLRWEKSFMQLKKSRSCLLIVVIPRQSIKIPQAYDRFIFSWTRYKARNPEQQSRNIVEAEVSV